MNTITIPEIVAEATYPIDTEMFGGRLHITGTVTATINNEDWETLVDMAGFGINYWATAAVVDTDDFTYTVTDGEEEATKTLTAKEMLTALIRIAYDDLADDDNREYAQRALAGDYGDVDATLADLVTQVAMYGTIIYG